MEDKIVQQATLWILSAIYEEKAQVIAYAGLGGGLFALGMIWLQRYHSSDHALHLTLKRFERKVEPFDVLSQSAAAQDTKWSRITHLLVLHERM